MKKTIGILAHVDAGKTTFSEQVLFRMGALRSLGRVDHQDAFLDAHPIEKRRGITIFSDQAVFQAGEDTYYWLDTPGHVDFSPEMERAIDAMDYALVVVSCVEGVQSHTETVWRLLKKHQVPTFLFLNKIDRAGADPAAVVEQIRARLSPEAVCCDGLTPDSMPDTLMESIAERDEAALDQLLQGNTAPAFYQNILIQEIRSRALFPVFSGAALSGAGVDAFLKMLLLLTRTEYAARERAPFSAKVYKIRHEKQGGRVCFFKVLSGSVQVRDEVCGQKITELRQYQGMKYQLTPRCSAGDLCAVPGLNGVKIGDILGANAARRDHSESEPMLQSTVTFDPPVRSDQVLRALRELEEEDPTLCVENDSSGLSIRVMGEIQLDVLTELLQERYGLNVRFGNRRVIFLETIAEPAIGIGHYEPLRHYAEVHLRLVPGPRGSGIRFESKCHVDILGLNWQRLIETHVFEKQHRGVLTGAPLTDVTVQLLTGRAHLKHTEGGDFREATYRAIRNALMNAKSVLLEPVCAFTLRAPAELYGRLAGDMTRLRADCEPPVYAGDMVEISGQATFREISEYARNLPAQTHGRGALTYRLDHYTPARDTDALVAESGYNPLADDTPDSVFCARGAGFVVHWQDVPAYAHLPQEYCD